MSGFITGKSKKMRQEQERVAQLSDIDKARYFAKQAEMLLNGGAHDLANLYSGLAAAYGAVALNETILVALAGSRGA